MSCLFCQIAEKSLPAKIVYEDDEVTAFHDIAPQAPLHVLVIPRRHIASLNELSPDDAPLVGKVIERARMIAAEHGYDRRGYRLVLNCNRDGGQTVFHLHCHLLAGRAFHWPPG